MATWTDDKNHTFEFDDDKVNFNDWIMQKPSREQAWYQACQEYRDWKQKNPSSTDEYNGKTSEMFWEWIQYANAHNITLFPRDLYPKSLG